MTSIDFDTVLSPEQAFFDAGYADGRAHGRIHGLIEGRALGREKGFEMWEELGFYESFANTWLELLKLGGKDADERVSGQVANLVLLVNQFPRVNPSSVPSNAYGEEEVDISRLLRQIRSRYKALCALLGVRPTLRAAESIEDDQMGTEATTEAPLLKDARMKKSIWATRGSEPPGLSF